MEEREGEGTERGRKAGEGERYFYFMELHRNLPDTSMFSAAPVLTPPFLPSGTSEWQSHTVQSLAFQARAKD